MNVLLILFVGHIPYSIRRKARLPVQISGGERLYFVMKRWRDSKRLTMDALEVDRVFFC